MIDNIVNSSEFLTVIAPNKTSVITGVLLELVVLACVLGIPVLMYPILKEINGSAALGYLGFRMIEGGVTIYIVLSALGLLTLSQEYVALEGANPATYQLMGALFHAGREWALLIYIVIYGFGATLFYSMLFKAKLVPRFISIWGFCGLVIILTGVAFDMLGFDVAPEMYGIVLGLNEIFLGFWLIFKGFSAKATI